MKEKLSYLQNFNSDTLYINDAEKGKFITVVNEKKEEGVLPKEFQVSKQVKLAIKAFYADGKDDVTYYEIIKFKNDTLVEKVSLSSLGLAKILEFNNLLESLDIKNSSSQKISIQKINFASVLAALESEDASKFIQALENDSSLTKDVIAISHRKKELIEFEKMLSEDGTEPDWQKFFEKNNWVLGYGLNYIFLDGVKDKLEQTVSGHNFNEKGKRTDALMKTKAEISQYVLVELKKPDTKLLEDIPYRVGCWQPSLELSGAVIQIQKTAFEFLRNSTNVSDKIKDHDGKFSGEEIYKVTPKTYVVCGKLGDLADNEDKIKCFEMYRNSLSYPEIITYDELFERAKCIVKTLETKREDQE